MGESYYDEVEVLREPSLLVAQRLKHSNRVLGNVLDVLEDLETSNSSRKAHIENRERLKWRHFAEGAERDYKDAEYIINDLLEGNIPTERSERSYEMDIEWKNPSMENPVFEAYREHEKNRKNYQDPIETNEFQLLMSEAVRYRQLINEAQEYDLTTEEPFTPIDDAEIIEETAKK